VERKGSWLKVIATQRPNGRHGWVAIGAVSLVANPWRVEADLSDRHVTVFQDDRVVRRFRVAIGRPGTPTPTGRFAVTDKLELIGGSAAYGCCALALSGHQPHIAQGWSGGDRIAIHGTHQTWSIGQAASLGCLRARDSDVRWIVNHVFLGTIVEISR
jgi:lipoprotein-anchoring transpeptidase ErfK/SrfK